MSRNKKSILIVLVILLAVLGIYFLFKDDHQEKGSAKSGGPAMEFSNIEMKEDKDGQSVWRIKAKHVSMSRDKNSADMEGIEAYFLKDGNELKLNADAVDALNELAEARNMNRSDLIEEMLMNQLAALRSQDKA